jgi:DNA polymerase III subunit chi
MQVDFYILSETEVESLARVGAQVISKAQALDFHVHVLGERDVLDGCHAALWALPDRFIPAEYADAAAMNPDAAAMNPKVQPAVLLWQSLPNAFPFTTPSQLLINTKILSTLPTPLRAFNRIVEMVIDNPLAKEAARQRYRLYQQQKCTLQTHTLGQAK